MDLLISTLIATSEILWAGSVSLVKPENYYFSTSTNSVGHMAGNCSLFSAFQTLTKLYYEYKAPSFNKWFKNCEAHTVKEHSICSSFEPFPTCTLNCVNMDAMNDLAEARAQRRIYTFLKAIFGKRWAILKHNSFYGQP